MSVRRTAQVTLDLPSADVDLESWLFGLSDAEYQACARGHRAAGVFTDERGRGSVNVESIGGNLLIQHYRALHAERSHMEMYSAASMVYLLHLVPVTASVRWTLTVTPKTESSAELTCAVEVGLHPVLRALGGLMAVGTSSGGTSTKKPEASRRTSLASTAFAMGVVPQNSRGDIQ